MSYEENNDDVITQHQHTWWMPNVESTTENWISNTIECGLVHLTVMASVSNAMINCRHCVHCKGHSYWPTRSFQSPFASIIITRSINCAISTGSWILDHTNFSRPTWCYWSSSLCPLLGPPLLYFIILCSNLCLLYFIFLYYTLCLIHPTLLRAYLIILFSTWIYSTLLNVSLYCSTLSQWILDYYSLYFTLTWSSSDLLDSATN